MRTLRLMRTMKLGFTLCLILGLNMACKAQATKQDKELDLLMQYMTGSFSSAKQAAADSAYFDISLHMARIWQHRPTTEGYWLYVEQAMASRADKPYRQRVYHVYRDGQQRLVSAVFELRKPLRFAGQYALAAPLAGLTPDSLLPRQGCEIVLVPNAQGFEGSTGDRTCPSNLRGASFATSQVILTEQLLESWDRGFDAAGKQVWGAEKGGYRFVKQR